MKNKKITLLSSLLLLLITSLCFADTKIGVGTGIVSGLPIFTSGQIVVPIKIGSSLMIEPYFGASIDNQEADKGLPSYFEENSEYYQYGVGIYGISGLLKDFEIYYGASLGGARQNVDIKQSGLNGGPERTRSSERTEYIVKPTLGISYLVNENFLFSIDLGLLYSWSEEDNFTEGTKDFSVDSTQTRTQTRILLRYLF